MFERYFWNRWLDMVHRNVSSEVCKAYQIDEVHITQKLCIGMYLVRAYQLIVALRCK
jgi:hypothetical protein